MALDSSFEGGLGTFVKPNFTKAKKDAKNNITKMCRLISSPLCSMFNYLGNQLFNFFYCHSFTSSIKIFTKDSEFGLGASIVLRRPSLSIIIYLGIVLSGISFFKSGESKLV